MAVAAQQWLVSQVTQLLKDPTSSTASQVAVVSIIPASTALMALVSWKMRKTNAEDLRDFYTWQAHWAFIEPLAEKYKTTQVLRQKDNKSKRLKNKEMVPIFFRSFDFSFSKADQKTDNTLPSGCVQLSKTALEHINSLAWLRLLFRMLKYNVDPELCIDCYFLVRRSLDFALLRVLDQSATSPADLEKYYRDASILEEVFAPKIRVLLRRFPLTKEKRQALSDSGVVLPEVRFDQKLLTRSRKQLQDYTLTPMESFKLVSSVIGPRFTALLLATSPLKLIATFWRPSNSTVESLLCGKDEINQAGNSDASLPDLASAQFHSVSSLLARLCAETVANVASEISRETLGESLGPALSAKATATFAQADTEILNNGARFIWEGVESASCIQYAMTAPQDTAWQILLVLKGLWCWPGLLTRVLGVDYIFEMCKFWLERDSNEAAYFKVMTSPGEKGNDGRNMIIGAGINQPLFSQSRFSHKEKQEALGWHDENFKTIPDVFGEDTEDCFPGAEFGTALLLAAAATRKPEEGANSSSSAFSVLNRFCCWPGSTLTVVTFFQPSLIHWANASHVICSQEYSAVMSYRKRSYDQLQKQLSIRANGASTPDEALLVLEEPEADSNLKTAVPQAVQQGAESPQPVEVSQEQLDKKAVRDRKKQQHESGPDSAEVSKAMGSTASLRHIMSLAKAAGGSKIQLQLRANCLEVPMAIASASIENQSDAAAGQIVKPSVSRLMKFADSIRPPSVSACYALLVKDYNTTERQQRYTARFGGDSSEAGAEFLLYAEGLGEENILAEVGLLPRLTGSASWAAKGDATELIKAEADFKPDYEEEEKRSLKTLDRYLKIKPTVDTWVSSLANEAAFPSASCGPFKIEFRNVSFSYNADGAQILNDLSFVIEPGMFVGLVGPSGCGKSTIFRLLTRMRSHTKGEILINDRPIEEYPVRWLRRRLGIVQQSLGLLNGSVKSNLQLSDLQMTRDSMHEALAGAKAQFLYDKPLKENTPIPVDDRDQSLSGGEVQRLSIARVMVKDRKKTGAYLLDEATSALDVETEQAIQENLFNLAHQRNEGRTESGTQSFMVEEETPKAESSQSCATTVICIAHRLFTLKKADMILVLDEEGKIQEKGSFQELANKPDGNFARLVELQDTEEGNNKEGSFWSKRKGNNKSKKPLRQLKFLSDERKTELLRLGKAYQEDLLKDLSPAVISKIPHVTEVLQALQGN